MNRIITDFFEDVDFEKEGREYLEPLFSKLCENDDFLSIKRIYEKDMLDKDAFMNSVDKLSEKTGIHNYTVGLLCLILLTGELKKKYSLNGYGMDLYRHTIIDLRYKANECFEVKGVWGTFVADWLFKYFLLGRFAFGRLQHELFEVPEQFVPLTKTKTAVKIHIPRSGEPLTPESIDKSLAVAKQFFGFDGTIPVVCSSYLLYDKLLPLYPSESNLKRFAERFTILSQTDDAPGDYPNMWRLFDMDYTGNIDDYPENSRLHRAVKQYLKDGGITGVALGFFFF